MIRGPFFLILSALSLYGAYAKKNPTNLQFNVSSTAVLTPCTVYSSSWETIPDWQLTESKGSRLYTYSRLFAQVSSSVLKEGVVRVFAKGYDFESVSKAEEKPLSLPFYIAMANEEIPHPYAWSFEVDEGKIKIGLSMHSALEPKFEEARKAIQLRFFVLSPEFLRQQNLSVGAVRKMSYGQLVTLFNTTP